MADVDEPMSSSVSTGQRLDAAPSAEESLTSASADVSRATEEKIDAPLSHSPSLQQAAVDSSNNADPFSSSSPSSSSVSSFSSPARPSLLRQRSVAIQRLRLDASDKQPCTVVLQRLQILHKRSAEAAVPSATQREHRKQRRRLHHQHHHHHHQPQQHDAMDVDRVSVSSEQEADDDEEDLFDDAAEYDDEQQQQQAEAAEDDDGDSEHRAVEEGEDEQDGVLVAAPGVHVADCLLAVNESDNKLAVAYRRHLFIHTLHAKTTAIAHFATSSSSSAQHLLDEYGEVSQEQRVNMEWARDGDREGDEHTGVDRQARYADGIQQQHNDEAAGDDDDSINVRLQRDTTAISALCWYRCEQRDWLLVGYASGMLRCYHSNGRLAFAHVFHPSPIKQVKYFATANSQLSNLSDTLIHTGASMNSSRADAASSPAAFHPPSSSSASSGSGSGPTKHRFDVLVVHSDSLCVIGGKSIRAYLRVDLSAHSQLLSTSRRENIALSLHNLQQMKDGIWRHQKWKLKGQAAVEDAVKCERLSPLTLDELFAPPPSNLAQSESPSFLVAGLDPMLAYYSPAAEPFTLASAVSVAGQLGTMVASAVTSKVFGFAKSWFGGRGVGKDSRGGQTASQAAAAASAAKKQKRSAPAPLPMPIIDLPVNRALRDATRALTRITVDPISGHYACCADSLGRVLLFESESMVAVRMWKGYREAKTAWIVQPNLLSPQQEQQLQHHQQQSSSAALPSALSLYLALYAPRRGLLELWAVPQGRRSAHQPTNTAPHRSALSNISQQQQKAYYPPRLQP